MGHCERLLESWPGCVPKVGGRFIVRNRISDLWLILAVDLTETESCRTLGPQ